MAPKRISPSSLMTSIVGQSNNWPGLIIGKNWRKIDNFLLVMVGSHLPFNNKRWRWWIIGMMAWRHLWSFCLSMWVRWHRLCSWIFNFWSRPDIAKIANCFQALTVQIKHMTYDWIMLRGPSGLLGDSATLRKRGRSALASLQTERTSGQRTRDAWFSHMSPFPCITK